MWGLIAGALLFGAGPIAPPAGQAESVEPLMETPVCTISADTPVLVETMQLVDSINAKPGDRFAIQLDEPLTLNGKVLLPEGTSGVGEVVHAKARQKFSGHAGELIVAARYLEHDGVRVPLKGLRINRAGTQKHGLFFMGTTVAPTLTSEDVTIASGTSASAKIAADVALPCPEAIYSSTSGK